MPVAPKVLADIKQSIRSCDSDQLVELNHFVVNLIKQQRRNKNYTQIASFAVGDIVRINANVKPIKYANQEATIISIRQQKVVIKLKSNGMSLTCPAASVTKS